MEILSIYKAGAAVAGPATSKETTQAAPQPARGDQREAIGGACGLPELRSETARARGAGGETSRGREGPAVGRRRLHARAQADRRAAGAAERNAVRRFAKPRNKTRGAGAAQKARAGRRKSRAEFYGYDGILSRVSEKMLRRNKFCAAGSGIFIPPPAPRRLVKRPYKFSLSSHYAN